MAVSSATAALVAKIMAKAVNETIQRLEDILEDNLEGPSELAPTTDCDHDEPRHLKAWFMANLAHPYPPLPLRRLFASELGVSLRNIDTQFTNWRRRTGWSHINRTWAGGTERGMATLLSRYTSGEESRPHVCSAIRRMTEYLEEDRARQWVTNILLPADEEKSLSESSRSSSLSLASHILSTPPSSSPASSTEPSGLEVPSIASRESNEDEEPLLAVFTKQSSGNSSSTKPSRKRRRSASDEVLAETPRTGPKARIGLQSAPLSQCAASSGSSRHPTPGSDRGRSRRSASKRAPETACAIVPGHHRHLAVELQSVSHDGLATVAMSDDEPTHLDWLALDTSSCVDAIPGVDSLVRN